MSEIEPSLEAAPLSIPDEPQLRGGPLGQAVRLAAAAGLLIGAFELVVSGFSLAVPLSLLQWLVLGVLILALDAGVAALVAWGIGAVVRRVDVPVGLAVGLLVAVYVVPGLLRADAEGQTLALLVLSVVPALLGIAAALQARALRRSRIPVLYGAAVVSVVAIGVGAVSNRPVDAVATVAADKPSIVLVTIDGWGADPPGGEIPALDALTAGGIRFADAVTPTPGSRAANATILAGLHPLRHQVLDDDDLLSRGYQTVFEELSAAGYPTAAFVSSSAVASGSGLDQGFTTFDDQWSLLRRSAIGDLLLRLADPVGPWRARSGTDTAEAFARWATGRKGPFAVWIHLADPHRAELGVATDPDALATAAARIAEFVPEGALVVVAGTHGELAGRHGGTGNRTLYDPVVHVPLAIRFPGPPPKVPEVTVQVRLMDVASSILDGAGFEPLAQSEGVPLIAYGTGFRKATISCGLVGRDVDGDWLLGVRNNGVKVIVGVGEAREELYLLATDPEEANDRHDDQNAVLNQVHGLLSSDRAALVELTR